MGLGCGSLFWSWSPFRRIFFRRKQRGKLRSIPRVSDLTPTHLVSNGGPACLLPSFAIGFPSKSKGGLKRQTENPQPCKRKNSKGYWHLVILPEPTVD